MRRTTTIAAFWLLLAMAGTGHALTQTITLQPGWNAIFVELQPTDNDIAAVFAGLPVRGVWRFQQDAAGTAFVSDPAEGMIIGEGWRGWFPDSTGRGYLSNLFTVRGWQAYLVEIGGSTSQTLTIDGEVAYRPHRWAPSAFTLTGFEVDPAGPPTFASYFETSSAHQGNPRFALQPSGVWLPVGNQQPIEPGRSYWVWTEGASSYQGPLEVSLDRVGTFDFGGNIEKTSITFENRAQTAVDLTITRAVDGTRVPLRLQNLDPETGQIDWPVLPDLHTIPVAAADNGLFALAIHRAGFVQTDQSEVLEINNGLGIRKRYRLLGRTVQPIVPAGAKTTSVHPLAGLWIGMAQIRAVSEAQLGFTEPTAVGTPALLRVLIHVDGNGNATLLKEATRMRRPPVTGTDPETGDTIVIEPGRDVLLTDEDLIPNYEGLVARGNDIVGFRYSTVAYDFPERELPLDGQFDHGLQMTGTILLPFDHPTNPFYHRYHPDHDNKRQGITVRESQDVRRELEITLDPLTTDDPAAGSELVSGSYRETLFGLHRNPIAMTGKLMLERVIPVAVLNDQ